MRRTILLGAALAMVSTAALPDIGSAQTAPAEQNRKVQPRADMSPHGPAGDPAARIIELREELSLTDEQIARIHSIREELQSQNAPLLAQIRTVHERMRADRPRPTEDQMVEMRERRAAMRDSMRSRAERLTPEQRQAMTPEQRAQMRERMRAERGDRMGAMRDHVGGDQPRGMPAELRPVMEQIRENTRTAAAQLRALLTAEQQEKLRELRPDSARGGAMMRGGQHGPQNRGAGAGAARR